MSEQYTAEQRRAWKPRANPWFIASSVTLAAFMELLDTTIVNVSLPHIAGSMAASQDEATWTLTSYLLANSIILPISGFFERALGRKRFFLICIAMFTICSVLCGLAQSLPQLIIFRLLQGMFGGGLQPSQQSIILDTFDQSERGKAFGLVAIATIVAPIIGPSLGGVITDNASWRWIFLINVPFGLLAFFLVTRLVEDPPWREEERKRTKLHVDYIGLSLIALGFGSMQIMLDRGEDDDWLSSNFIRTLAVTATIGLTSAIFWLSYARRPIVSLKCFTDRNYVVGFLCISATAFMLYSSGVLLPQLAQQDYGYTATIAGYMLTPGAAVLVVFIPIIARIMPYVQARFIVATGFSMMAVAFYFCHHIAPDTDFTTLMLMRGLQTLGIGCLFAPINSLAYSSLSKELNADAASLMVMIRNVTGSIGISVATSLVTSRSQVRMAYLSDKISNFSQPYLDTLSRLTRTLTSMGEPAAIAQSAASGRIYRTLISQASILGYMDVFAFCSILALVVVPLTFFFSPLKAGARQGE